MLQAIISRLRGTAALEALEERAARFHRTLHLQVDAMVPDGATVFLGDSHVYGLLLSNVTEGAVKFAVGGDSSVALLERMRELKCLARASRVVICIGTNDVIERTDAGLEDRYRQILAAVPAGVPVILSSIPPLQAPERRERARQAVEASRRASSDDPRCTFVDAFTALSLDGAPMPGVLWDDGIHLTALGYQLWTTMLRKALGSQP